MNDDTRDQDANEARLLLRAARSAVLATAGGGAPFASLVTPATAPDGSILLLLSDLAEHTRQLRQDARCAVMVTGSATGPNPQTAPRLTVTGTATITADPALHARWVAAHPYAAFYAGFGDFNLWQLDPAAGHFIGGFARARRLARADLVADPAPAAAVLAAEPGIVQHCNRDHADALDRIARKAGHAGTGWRMTGCDVDGFDLVEGEHSVRIAWPGRVDGPGAIRTALIHLADAAKTEQ